MAFSTFRNVRNNTADEMSNIKNTEAEPNVVWKNSENKIRILNPKDFVIPDFINTLSKDYGFDKGSLGLTNSNDVKSRLETMRILMDQGTRRSVDNYLEFFKGQTSLPTTENEFLRQYENKKSVFWEGAKKLVDFLSKHQESESIKVIIKKINDNLHLQEKENKLAESISERLKNVAFLEGVIKLHFNVEHSYRGDNNVLDSVTVGKKKFHATWSSDFVANIPKWTKNPVMKFLRITDLIQNFSNGYVSSIANTSSIVKNLPYCVIKDIEKVFYEKEYYKVLERYKHCIFTIHFKYSAYGLRVDFVGVENEVKINDFEFEEASFKGFSKFEKMRFVKQSKKLTKLYKQTYTVRGLRPIYDELQDSLRLFSTIFNVPSPNTDIEYKWYALRNLYEEEQALVSQLIGIRSYVMKNLIELKRLSNIIAYMQNVAERRNLSLCIPEITETGSGTTFKDLAPIEIFNKSNELIPFNLPTINGHILCLTGRHGGGKSVAGKSILSSVYLAQSGLPIFAKEFKTEIKTVIGSIVNDDGVGSTATVFVNKLKTLLKGLESVPKGESIVFIDEIGKGTQESAIISTNAADANLGKRILNTLKQKGYSVIFNSQIMDLARYAQNELDARCYVVDKNHKFVEGIGDGQMNELIKEKGLDKLLLSN